MNEEHEDRIYQGIRRMVIWDEPRADVFHRLEVNGIVGAKAEEIYGRARAERIAIIRADSIRKTGFGLLLLLAGIGVFFGFWSGLGGITRPVLTLCVLSAAFGVWRFFKGLFGFFCASSKEGSLANEE